MKANMKKPGWKDLENATVAFEEHEPHDLFYRIATILIEQEIEGNLEISIIDV